MAKAKRDDLLDVMSPRGVAVWPKLDKPTRYDKKQKKRVIDEEEGKFEVELALEGEDAEKFQKKIKDFAVEQGLKLKSVKNWPWRDELEKETEEPTGRVLFKFKQYATNKDGSTKRIPLWLANGKSTYPKGTKLTSGSTIKISGYGSTYTELGGGVSLFVNSVQVIKMVEYEARNPGFGNEDDDDEGDAPDTSEVSEDNDGDESPSDF